jgi:N,N-dimethylformamidase
MYHFDKTRLDLAREFRANPFGEHSPDLQYLLNIMRTPGTEPFHVLLVDQPYERWTLAEIEPGGRKPPRRTNMVFSDLKEAEWHVFKLRWARLAGEELPIE